MLTLCPVAHNILECISFQKCEYIHRDRATSVTS